MSSTGISFGGLASGLDTKSIIAALMAVEQRPITALEQKKTSLTKQKGLFGDLGNLLDKLQTAAKNLARTSDFLVMKANSSDATVLTATASNSAQSGTHTVIVNDLATAQINRSNGFASKDTSLDLSGTVWINFGTGAPLSFNIGGDGNNTLQEIANTINATGDSRVTADVVDTGRAGNERYNLVLRGTEVGATNAFTVTLDAGGPNEQAFVDGFTNHRVSEAKDSAILLDGILVHRSSNQVTDAIPGVTLDLLSAPGTTKPITVTVGTDAEDTTKKVQDFVDAYNKVVDFVAEQNVLGSDGKAKNPLFGDGTLRGLRSALRDIVGGSNSTTGNAAFAMLSQIGIKSDRDGKLTFDSGKFGEALADDENAVTALFADATNGIAKKLQTRIDVYTDSLDGLLKARTEGYDRTIKNTQSRIDQGNARLDRFQKALEQKYANLETLLGKLQSQGSALNSIK